MSGPSRFALNGRFLSQPVTGVQRYARGIAAAMDAQLEARNQKLRLLTPRNASSSDWTALQAQTMKPLTGHAWEQFVLPVKWRGGLLNLCNTAPVLKSDQIICIHDASVFTAPHSYAPHFRYAYQTLQPLIAKRAIKVTTVSKDSARQIAEHFSMRASDIEVLSNGHEHAFDWKPENSKLGPKLVSEAGWEPQKFVLALGSRAPHKNLKLLIDIAPRLADYGLNILVAGGSDGVFSKETLSDAANVKMTGYVTDDDLAFLMQNALCLAFPSWTEGFGLPIVESMALDCLVVSSDRASMPEVCGDAALLAAPDDPEAWVRQIVSLHKNPALREDLIVKAKEQVKAFSWSNSASGYLDLMEYSTVSSQSAEKNEVSQKSRDTQTGKLNVTVAIATIGRKEIVGPIVENLISSQTLKPKEIIISCVDPSDAGSAVDLPDVKIVTGPKGLPAQRNTALKALSEGADIVVFFDDDFIAAPDWLETMETAFRSDSTIVGYTGRVLADGIKGPGLSVEDALQIVENDTSIADWDVKEPFSPYGCNMAFRVSAIGDTQFDERLVLYGWLEDRDFAAALAKKGGRFIKSATSRGVHMGTKRGRVSGVRLGYSQIVNPIYMHKKGTMTTAQVADHILRNVLSNLVLSLRPEPYIDRRGRLLGNLKGVARILSGKLQPEFAAQLNVS